MARKLSCYFYFFNVPYLDDSCIASNSNLLAFEAPSYTGGHVSSELTELSDFGITGIPQINAVSESHSELIILRPVN
jgi:hypothetical protein